MTSHRDSDERMTPPQSHSPQDLRISQPASAGSLQPSSTSAFRRVSHSSPAVTSPAYRRDSESSDHHSDHEDHHSYEQYHHQNGFKDSHSKFNGERLSPEQRDLHKNDSEKDSNNSSHRQVTPSKPKLSFSVEAIMASSSTRSKSPVTLSSHHHESRDSSFSSPGSSSSTHHERSKENCSPASSEASSRGSDFHSPPPNPAHHHPGYNVEGLLSKASVMPGRIPGEHGAGLPHPHPFLAAAGSGPDGIHWPWLGGAPPHPTTSSATGPLSKYDLFSLW